MDASLAASLLDEFAGLPEEVRNDGADATDAVEAAILLDEFAKLPGRIERLPTFMEIGGYPHYENVCSNFLAFFFDPEEAHGFGNLFLDALYKSLSAGNDEIAFDGAIVVEREVSTDAGNRIDILITSDTSVVLIENKILAGIVNPFEDYAHHLEGETFRELSQLKVLLTLKPNSEGRQHGFVNLTYPAFIERVRSMLGLYVSDAETRYLIIALDFLNTLENLQEGSRMNSEFVKLLSERGDEVEKLLDSVKSFRAEIRGKVKDLQSLVALEERDQIRQFLWRDRSPLRDVLVYEVKLEDGAVIGIDTNIRPWGWEIEFFPRKEENWPRVRSALESAEVPFEEKHRFIYPTKFSYDEDLTIIAPVVKDLVERIAAAAR